MARQVGCSSSKCNSESREREPQSVSRYSHLSASGIVVRLSESVDWTVFNLERKCARSGSLFSSAFYSLVLTFPLKVCRLVLLGMEKALGVKHRSIVCVQRKSNRRSLTASGDNQGEKIDGTTLPNGKSCDSGVKFDFSNSPQAARLLNVISPSKRRMLSNSDSINQEEEDSHENDEEEDGTSDESSSCEEDSSADEVIDHYKLLNTSDQCYKSEDDPDFDPSELEEESEDREGRGHSDCESEPPSEVVPQQSPCLTDHSVVELKFDEGDSDAHLRKAELCDVNSDNPVMQSCESPLKSTENIDSDPSLNGAPAVKHAQQSGDLKDEIDQENAPQQF